MPPLTVCRLTRGKRRIISDLGRDKSLPYRGFPNSWGGIYASLTVFRRPKGKRLMIPDLGRDSSLPYRRRSPRGIAPGTSCIY